MTRERNFGIYRENVGEESFGRIVGETFSTCFLIDHDRCAGFNSTVDARILLVPKLSRYLTLGARFVIIACQCNSNLPGCEFIWDCTI